MSAKLLCIPKRHKLVLPLLYKPTHTPLLVFSLSNSPVLLLTSSEGLSRCGRLGVCKWYCLSVTQTLLDLQSTMTPVGRDRAAQPITSPLSPPHINERGVGYLLKQILLSVPSHLTIYQLEMALRPCSVSS